MRMCRTSSVCFLCYKFIVFYSIVLLFTFTQVKGHRLEFTIEPTDVVAEPAAPTALHCAAQLSDGSLHQPVDARHVTWRIQLQQNTLEQVPFPGDTHRVRLTNGSLHFSDVHGYTGEYRCFASLDGVGSVISRTATVKIATLSGFEQEPRDISVYPKQVAYFPCRALADPSATVRWLKDERPFTLDESRMTLLPSGALEIDFVENSDQGTYRCNASGLSQYRLSNKATLTLNTDREMELIPTAPTFIAKPHPASVREGETVTLDCAAIGNPPPFITWLRNGLTIDIAHLDSRFKKVGTGSLQITNVEESDAGIYQCRAENEEDSLDAPANLEVQVPPRFLKKPQDIREVATKDIEFECEIYGKPEPKIQWYKNGEKIMYNDYLQLVNGYNLKILGLLPSDSGIFQCLGSNPAGNIQASATLTIIDEIATTQASRPRSTTRFTRSKNTRNPFAQKVFASLKTDDDNLQPLSNDDNSETPNLDTLGPTNFGYLNAKEYEIHKKPNHDFDPASILTMLKSDKETDPDRLVGEAHYAFTENPLSIPSASPTSLGESSVLTDKDREVGLPSEPKDLEAVIVRARFVTLSWKPPEVTNGNILSYQVGYRQEGSKRERTQITKTPRLEEINISGLSPDHTYLFRVTAINQRGAGRPSAILRVITQSEEHVPSAPLNVHAVAIGPNGIRVSWEEPEITNGPVQNYKVYYMEDSTEHNVVTSNLQYDLVGLSVYTEYNIWVVAVNKNGPGSATNELVLRTFSSHPTAAPSNVTAEVGSSTSVIIHWEPPPTEHQNGIIIGYRIRYKKQGGRGGGKTFSTDANIRMHVLNDLDRASTYQFKVQAFNINGTGPWSEWVSIDTFENDLDESQVPDSPVILNVRSMANSIAIMWGPPSAGNIKIRGYTLGWGEGVPDVYMDTIDGKQRYYEIKDLKPNTEYVISLRAKNEVGDGKPAYTDARTKLLDEETFVPPPPPDQILSLIPPVGLKAIVLSASTVVLYWTDTTLSKNQYVTDNRYYIVRYSSTVNRKERYFNATDLNCMISDLKPYTHYEFMVKVVKGRRESDWSMVVSNTTSEAPPTSYPRDLQVLPFKDNPHMVILKWLSPKQSNGVITGYLIQYTTDNNNKDRDWIVEGVIGNRNETIIRNLKASMTYYFKIQARNNEGYGPYSPVVSFTTEASNGMYDEEWNNKSNRSGLSNTMILYLIGGGSILAVTFVALAIIILCCRKNSDPNTTPDRNKKGYQKTAKNQNIKPPDLWIHHDQMELKAMEKSHGGGTGGDCASSSGATTLPRSSGHDYDTHDCHGHPATSSLDKRTYVPSYVAVATATPINNPPPSMHPSASGMMSSMTDSPTTIVTPSGLVTRPAYPRTQYTISRAHVTIDQNALESPYAAAAAESTPYDRSMSSAAAGNYASLPQQSTPLSSASNTMGSGKAQSGVSQQGHPLKSFSVPAPPPTSAPGTPAHAARQHNVAQVSVRPITSSPYKKVPLSSTITATPHLRANPLSTISSEENRPLYTSHDEGSTNRNADETGPLLGLANSTSTEELNQEMANLEGLMKDLNAITASEFEC